MRIATAQAFDAAVDNITRQRSELSDAQTRLSSLKRVNRASDDPTAAARIERALASVERNDTSQRALEASRNAMTQGESALGATVELLQQAREALVASGNGSYSDAERKGLAEQIRGIRSQLLAVANRDDGAGRALFGGQGAAATPFSEAPGGVRFDGSTGQATAGSADGLPTTLDGAAIWLSAPTGNGVFETRSAGVRGDAWIDSGHVSDPAAITGSRYTLQFDVGAGGTSYSVLRDGAATAQAQQPYSAGRAIVVDGMSVAVRGTPAQGDRFELAPSTPTLSVFDTLERVANELQTPGRGPGAVAQTTASGLRDVDALLGRVTEARSQAGSALQRLDTLGNQLATQRLGAQTERADAQDLDLVAAISDFQNRQTGMDAALKSYAMVQRMTLFQYING